MPYDLESYGDILIFMGLVYWSLCDKEACTNGGRCITFLASIKYNEHKLYTKHLPKAVIIFAKQLIVVMRTWVVGEQLELFANQLIAFPF